MTNILTCKSIHVVGLQISNSKIANAPQEMAFPIKK